MSKIILFLDIDGVINVSAASDKISLLGSYQGRELRGYPVPYAHHFLQQVDQSDHIIPIWLSSGWREYSIVWNYWSKTQAWRVGFPPSWKHTRQILQLYPQLKLDELEDERVKLINTLHSENIQFNGIQDWNLNEILMTLDLV